MLQLKFASTEKGDFMIRVKRFERIHSAIYDSQLFLRLTKLQYKHCASCDQCNCCNSSKCFGYPLHDESETQWKMSLSWTLDGSLTCIRICMSSSEIGYRRRLSLLWRIIISSELRHSRWDLQQTSTDDGDTCSNIRQGQVTSARQFLRQNSKLQYRASMKTFLKHTLPMLDTTWCFAENGNEFRKKYWIL